MPESMGMYVGSIRKRVRMWLRVRCRVRSGHVRYGLGLRAVRGKR
jgi:hypothetical protein